MNVVALSVDLMDRSKISAAYPDATMVRKSEQLAERVDAESLVLVDLNRLDDVALLGQLSGRVVAFGSHVDEALLQEAAETGAEAMPRSIFFRRVADGTL